MVKTRQEDKKYANKYSDADKACTDIVKTGAMYGSRLVVDTKITKERKKPDSD